VSAAAQRESLDGSNSPVSTTFGNCGLCHKKRQLQNSHLLPAAAYKLSRENNRRDPNPVIVTTTRAGSTSRQVSDHFLCAKCEDRFSRGGERYVLSQCARPGGKFALRGRLATAPVLYEESRFRVCQVGNVLGEKANQYLYFAASVFWRAAARRWAFEGATLERISLGTTYQEQFRRYLLDEAEFPENARLFVHVWSDDPIDFTTVFPCSVRVSGARRHKFCIPGILFILFLGGNAPREQDAGALNSGDGRFMWLCRWADDSLFAGFGKLVKAALRARTSQRRGNRRAV